MIPNLTDKFKNISGTLKDSKTAHVVLMTLGIVGLVSIAVLAPNALQMLKIFKGKKSYQKISYIGRSLRGLEQKGLISKVSKSGVAHFELTARGRLEYDRLILIGNLRRPKHWDHKWRLVIFDIKESRRGTRGKVRLDLLTFGFLRLQDSVWVYPYPCEDIVVLLKKTHMLGRDLLVIEASEIENDHWIRKHFALK